MTQEPIAETPLREGERVRLWIGTAVRGGWQYGIVTGIDTLPRVRGVEVTFDRLVNGQPTCYATHDEVERVTPPASPTGIERSIAELKDYGPEGCL